MCPLKFKKVRNVRNSRKAQTSLEYVLTTGIDITVIIIGAVILWQTNIFDPVPCDKGGTFAFAQIKPADWAAYSNSDTLALWVINEGGDTMDITEVNATLGDIFCTTSGASAVLPPAIHPGKNDHVILDCSGPPSISGKYHIGACYESDVSITYLNIRSGNVHISKGQLWGTIES